MLEHELYLLKLIKKSEQLYAELQKEGYLRLDIITIATLINDCAKSTFTIELTEKHLRANNAIH